jgi:glycosyltransferase involved in cell wall biosynthesis
LFITHDTNRAGAPILMLRLMQLLKSYGYGAKVLIKMDTGPLGKEFVQLADHGEVYWRRQGNIFERVRVFLFNKLGLGFTNLFRGTDLILNNTITNGWLIQTIHKWHKIPIISYVHELKEVTRLYTDSQSVEFTLTNSQFFLVPCEAVRNFLVYDLKVPKEKIALLNYFIPREIEDDELLARNLTHRPGLVVGGCGTLDKRKGIDLFIRIAGILKHHYPEVRAEFVWKGGNDDSLDTELRQTSLLNGVSFSFTSGDMKPFYKSIDLFILTSREDPYPLVVLEAATYSVPTICFDQSGGAPEFVGEDAGKVVEFESVNDVVETILYYYRDRERLRLHGVNAKAKVESKHQHPALIVNQFESAINRFLNIH